MKWMCERRILEGTEREKQAFFRLALFILSAPGIAAGRTRSSKKNLRRRLLKPKA
jgi:hypothetical protein